MSHMSRVMGRRHLFYASFPHIGRDGFLRAEADKNVLHCTKSSSDDKIDRNEMRDIC